MLQPLTAAPVWLVSNGFHTSLALRKADLPLGRTLMGDPRTGVLLIGWGATDFYRGHVNAFTFGYAMLGSQSILHVVPIRGTPGQRFHRSEIVRLELSAAQVRALAQQIERAFARDAAGQPVRLGAGYYADSRFYQARERFYFPYMCNAWIALKLRRVGVPIFVPAAISAPNLIWQAAKFGKMESRLQQPVDGY